MRSFGRRFGHFFNAGSTQTVRQNLNEQLKGVAPSTWYPPASPAAPDQERRIFYVTRALEELPRAKVVRNNRATIVMNTIFNPAVTSV